MRSAKKKDALNETYLRLTLGPGLIGLEVKRPDLPACADDEVWCKEINELNLFRLLGLGLLVVQVLFSSWIGLLFSGSLSPPCLFLPDFFLCSDPENLHRPVMRLNSKILLSWVELYL